MTDERFIHSIIVGVIIIAVLFLLEWLGVIRLGSN